LRRRLGFTDRDHVISVATTAAVVELLKVIGEVASDVGAEAPIV
jgi:hypothetical protein